MYRRLFSWLFQIDLAGDIGGYTKAFYRQRSFGVDAFIAGQFAAFNGGADCGLDLTVLRDADILEEFPHLHVEYFFVHDALPVS